MFSVEEIHSLWLEIRNFADHKLLYYTLKERQNTEKSLLKEYPWLFEVKGLVQSTCKLLDVLC